MIKNLTFSLFALVVGLTSATFINEAAAQTNSDCLLPTTNVGIVTCGQTTAATTKSADLVITSLNYNQNNHTFTAVIKNQGTAATPANTVIGVGYFVDGEKRTWGNISTPLAPGATTSVGTSLTGLNSGPYTIAKGIHIIKAWVDDVDRINESREGNNQFTKLVNIGGSSTPAPDVVVTYLNYNQNTHTFTAVVKNQGTAATPANTAIGVGYFVDGVQRTWGLTWTPLAPGATTTIGTSLDKTAGPYTIADGTHNIRALADDVNRFAESDEGNNDLIKSITIGSGGNTTNVPPTISGTPATKATKNAAYSFTPSATDTNGDTLTFAIQNKPAWATFNATTGRLSGTPTALGTHSNIRISVTDGKSAAVFLPAFSIEVINGTVVPPVSGDKWHPGIYIKVEDWQLTSPTQMNEIYRELETTPQIRGIKVVAMWGRHETRTNGVSTYNFQQIDNILNKLSQMDDKHLILMIPWREFDGGNGGDDLVPNDLRTGNMWRGNASWEHMDYDYLWAYKQTANPKPGNNYGYELKLWNSTIVTRLDKFIEALAKHVDDHPNFNMITTNESAGGEPVIPFVSGEGYGLQEEGQKKIYLSMRKHFTKSYVVPAFNFPRPFVKEIIPLLQDNKMGLGSPNMNMQEGLNLTGSTPGVLTYYPKLSGQLILAPEIQGVDLRSTNGPNTAIDNPSYESLYKRVRDDLKANYLVIQRNVPFWEGGRSGNETVPSLLNFLKTYPAIKNDPTGAGGLDHNKPDMVK